MKSVFKKIGIKPKKNKDAAVPEASDQKPDEATQTPTTEVQSLESKKAPEPVAEQNSPVKTSTEIQPLESNKNDASSNDDRQIEKLANAQVEVVANPTIPAGPVTGNLKKKGGEAFEISITPAKTSKKSTKPNHQDENHSDSDCEIDVKEPTAEGIDETTEEQVEKEALQKCKDLFGHDAAYNLQSTQWANRKEGIETINFQVLDLKGPIQEGTNIDPDQLKEKFINALLITRRALKDPVAPVCFSAFELFRNAMKVFSPILDTSMPVKNVCSSLVGPLLIKMSGEATGTNRRNQREACKCLLRLARTPQVEGLGIIVSKLSDESLPNRPRLSLLKLLINEFEFSKGPGLKLQMVMAITLPAMQIADDKTRKAAVGVIVAAYEVAGKRVLKYLNSVKPAMLKIIHRKLKESDEARGVVDSPFFTDPTPTSERPKTGAPRKIKKQADEMQVAGRAYLPHLDPSNSPTLKRNQTGPESDLQAKQTNAQSPYHNNAMQSNINNNSAPSSPTDKKQMMREKQFQAVPGTYGNGGNIWSAAPAPAISNMAPDDELLMEKILNG